ncbi:MAG: F0F1 ATP synthase subunit A, partial [Endomicrobium sp.]|nr:F0F1 ATP synthase subunit A [Endomicrobium sp.]
MHIRPDLLFQMAGFPVTNTFVATIVTDIVILSLVFVTSRKFSLSPGWMQNIVESVVVYFMETTEEIAGDRSSFIYSWVLSFFLFIVISNLISQFPGFESVRFYTSTSDHLGVPFLRAATSDLNLTLALAVVSVVVTHFLSVKHTGIKAYFSRFVTFKMFPIFLFVGILEFMNEVTKLVSFSFRLFGNIFAGERIMATMYSLCSFGVPIPFMFLELMVAIV